MLLVYDSRLATFDIAIIHRMSHDQQRQWVKHMDIPQVAYALELRQRGHSQNLVTKYMVSTNESVHNTLESNCENEIKTTENEVVRVPVESNNNETPSTHVCSTSVTQRDAQQKQTGANNKKRGQHKSQKMTRYMTKRPE